ncbi:MAG TPA: SGNH/GDSL hydrolase family protein [Gammaproteobacteria bacterium]|nr:SGNH/GDSL hydrolase family protein [Gammaproteobacteria bacterium]
MRIAAGFLVFLVFALPTWAQPPGNAPSSLFVLGDSLSDVGNAAAAIDSVLGVSFYPEFKVGFCNPADIYVFHRDCEELIYKKSRASNGPVAVEVLAAGLGLAPLEPSFHTVPSRPVKGTDYAVAGGTAAGNGIDDLAMQVAMLRLDRGPVLPADALYVIIIGGNDALAALHSAAEAQAGIMPSEDAGQIVAAAVAAIGGAVDALSASGAKRVIVANLPDLALLPVVRERASQLGIDEQAVEMAALQITTSFNDALQARLSASQTAHPDVRIEPFDLFSAAEQARLATEAAGKNVRDACFDSDTYRTSRTAQRIFDPDCAPGRDGPPRFDQFFFWDDIHPTAAVHAAIGNALLGLYEESWPALANEVGSAVSTD